MGYDVKQVQAQILKNYGVFRNICEKHHLRYFGIGGTALGAVRHKGFIPWDDDMDVAMPYEDFCKFRELAKDPKNTEGLELFDYNEHLHAKSRIIKLHDPNTTFVGDKEVAYPDRYIGIFLDIMPIYGAPDGGEAQERLWKKYNRLVHLNRYRRYPYSEWHDGPAWKNAVFNMLTLPLKVFPYAHFSRKAEKMLSRYEYGKTGTVMFGWRTKRRRLFFRREWFDEYDEVPFEETTIRIPKGYDPYLTQEFGDYMKLPPEGEQRSVHGPVIMDLAKPYREYAAQARKQKEA